MNMQLANDLSKASLVYLPSFEFTDPRSHLPPLALLEFGSSDDIRVAKPPAASDPATSPTSERSDIRVVDMQDWIVSLSPSAQTFFESQSALATSVSQGPILTFTSAEVPANENNQLDKNADFRSNVGSTIPTVSEGSAISQTGAPWSEKYHVFALKGKMKR